MQTLTARDVMNPDVLAAREDWSVAELASFLADNEISGAPVLDRGGRLVGVVSVTDIAQAAGDAGLVPPAATVAEDDVHGWEASANADEFSGMHLQEDLRQVREIMTPAVYSVAEETPVGKVAETMVDGHIHRLLVTRGDRVVGILTSSDLLGLLIDKG